MSTSLKFEQRIYQENLLLKKVLQVSVFPLNDATDPFSKISVPG
jgi:hypothetical protein